jgi:MoaA/NifB/PqqE/SkfB family radical SAM enzyme
MKDNKIYGKLAKQIHEQGLKNVLLSGLRSIRPISALGRHLDILGVLDGAYAYKGPGFAQIDLTNNCNNDCIGCWCNSPLLGDKAISPQEKKQTIPYARAIKLIDELYKMGTTHIYYAGGGEPFMHPEIMEILRHTKKRGITCYVNTNFTLVDQQKVKELIALKVDHLTVSIWAGTPEVYAATHPNKNQETFFKIKEMLEMLNRLKLSHPIIKIYNVIFNLNYHDIEKMIDLAFATNSESIEFTVIDTMPGKTDKLLLDNMQNGVLLQSCQRIKEKFDTLKSGTKLQLLGFDQFIRRISNRDSVAAQYDSDVIGKIPCYAGWAFVRILADGNVNSCLKSHRFPVGNILKQDFRKIWNGPLQRYFRNKTAIFDKNDPFFSLIGNDPNSQMGCYKSCDNLGHNINMLERITAFSSSEKKFLKTILGLVKLSRKV